MDRLIRGATVVDGTGAPPAVRDVGIVDGRLVLDAEGPATVTVDATGLVLAPGFIDPHTHYDAQLFWDPLASPSNVHGVTTAIGGNCGFTLAPLHEHDADYIRRMMAKVEGMPLEALESGVPWSWSSFADYLDAVDRQGTAVNFGVTVGHCALRLHVMGAAALTDVAGDEHVGEMVRLLHEAIDAGALGLSTTRSATHVDGDGAPVASRVAGEDELLALCAAAGEHEGTTLEGIVPGCLNGFTDGEVELLARMSAAAGGRPLNWNLLTIDGKVDGQLEPSRRARSLGARVVALTMPVAVPMNLGFGFYCAFNLIPGWGGVLATPVEERMSRLRDPGVRATMAEQAASKDAGVFRRLSRWGTYLVNDTGRTVAEFAAERGAGEFDTLLDIALDEDLRTVFWPVQPEDDWASKLAVWENDDVLLGGSDAGAHLDRMCGAPYTTRLLGEVVRDRQVLPLTRAVQMITDEPARMLGLRERGRIADGFVADLVLFDPDAVGSEPARLVDDLPGGASRLTAGSTGVVSVLVAGVETVRDGRATGATPAGVLRSGRDTTSTT